MKVIKADDFRGMVESASLIMASQEEYVNSLNVFPVPDGDTGTNMNLSFQSGADYVRESSSDQVGDLTKALSRGLLMGARGNSGVILSQIFRGFNAACEGKKTLNAQDLAQAFDSAVEAAFKSVMKPVEGTILTVIKDTAKAAMSAVEETADAIDVIQRAYDASLASLANTPNLLPVLKEVGVVDSGGQGLVFILQGFLEAVTGEAQLALDRRVIQTDVTELAHQETHHDHIASDDIEFGYCTEIMVQLDPAQASNYKAKDFRTYLESMGDSIVLVDDDDLVKVHVHTENPGQVIDFGQQYGELIKIKVDNMRQQHDQLVNRKDKVTVVEPVQEQQEYAIITVGSGRGVAKLFQSLGSTYMINGGQTMNPSIEDIVEAINHVNAKNVIILPNNKNIVMAAKQAAEVSEVEVRVVETKSVTQGMSVLLAFDPSQDIDANQAAMTAAIKNVLSAEVTHAIRDTSIDGVDIKQGDYLGIIEGKIVTSQANRQQVLTEVIQGMIDEDTELVTVLVGETGLTDEVEDALQGLADADDIEFESYDGNQPVYDYLISAE